MCSHTWYSPLSYFFELGWWFSSLYLTDFITHHGEPQPWPHETRTRSAHTVTLLPGNTASVHRIIRLSCRIYYFIANQWLINVCRLCVARQRRRRTRKNEQRNSVFLLLTRCGQKRAVMWFQCAEHVCSIVPLVLLMLLLSPLRCLMVVFSYRCHYRSTNWFCCSARRHGCTCTVQCTVHVLCYRHHFPTISAFFAQCIGASTQVYCSAFWWLWKKERKWS